MNISRYETALKSMNAMDFEDLIREIVSKEYGTYSNFQIEHNGKSHGKQAPIKGTPDIWFSYTKNGEKKYVFVEVSKQESRLFSSNGKVISDLCKCKQKIEDSNISVEKIIFACTRSIDIVKQKEYESFCSAFNCEFVFWGIDTIIELLKMFYPSLISKYLKLSSNKGNLITIKEFLSDNKLGTSHTECFCYRETEKINIIGTLFKDHAVILSGPSGCGKTRLAIEVANQLQERNNFDTYWIKLCNIDVIADITDAVSKKKNCLIIIDDANRVSFVKDILNFAATRDNLFIILTIRDYAVDSLEEWFKDTSYYHYPLLPLSHDQIKEIIRQRYGINNPKWLDFILSVSKGNLRFAIMTTEVLSAGDSASTTLATVFKAYFNEVYKDINLQNDDKIENFLVAVAFYKKFDMRDTDLVSKLCNTFDFDQNSFYKYVRISEEKELVNIHFNNNVIEIADQIFADYLCYKIIVLEKRVKLVDVYNSFFTMYKNKFIDVVQSLINIYGNDTIFLDEIHKLKDAVISTKDVGAIIGFFKCFANIFPEDSMEFCYNFLKEYAGDKVVYSQFGNSIIGDAINVITSFHEDVTYSPSAIDYLICLIQTKEELFDVLLGNIKAKFKINKKSSINGYNSQICLFENALSLTTSSNYKSKLLMTLLEMYYPLINDVSEMQGESLVFYKIGYANIPEYKKMRELLWKSMRLLINDGYSTKLVELLYKNVYGGKDDYSLRCIDKEYAIEIYKLINKDSLNNNILSFALLSPYRKMKDVRPLLEELYLLPCMKLYINYVCDISSQRLYGESLKKAILSDISQYADLSCLIREVAELEKTCSSNQSWKINEIISVAFNFIADNHIQEYDNVLYEFLRINSATNCCPYEILKPTSNKDAVLLFLKTANIKHRITWVAHLYFSLRIDEINEKNYYGALEFFTSEYAFAPCVWGNEQLLRLENYENYRPGFLIEILKFYVANNLCKGIFIETLFFNYVSIEELLKLFNNDIDLLGNAFIQLLQTSHTIDLNGNFSKLLISANKKYLHKIISTKLQYHNDYYDLKNLYSISGFIDELINCFKNDNRLYLNFEAERIVSRLPDDLYLDLIDKLVSDNLHDRSLLADFACIIKSRSYSQQIAFLDCLIKYGIAPDILKDISILDGPSSWSGSLIPHLKECLDLLVKYIESHKNLTFEYRGVLRAMVERLKKYIQNTEIHEFNHNQIGE